MRYLDEEEVAKELTAVTYKPGWEFRLHKHQFEGPCIDIAATLPNGYRPEESVDVNIRVPIPPLVSPAHFHDWLMWRLARVEAHELREFYRVDGMLVSDPHAEDIKMS